MKKDQIDKEEEPVDKRRILDQLHLLTDSLREW